MTAIANDCTPQDMPMAILAKINDISRRSDTLDLNLMMANAPKIPKLSARLSPIDCMIIAATVDIKSIDCIKLNDLLAGEVVLSYVNTKMIDNMIVMTIVISTR